MTFAADRYERLMSAARDPTDPATLALGGVLAHFGLHGLEGHALNRLLERHFPQVPARSRHSDPIAGGPPAVLAVPAGTALPAGEFDGLLALLREHRCEDSEETEWVACAIATACAGQNHLWEDMGLPSRETLSRVIRERFPTLYYKNTANLRWKRFFYKQLCERAEARLCKAPNCAVCSDYASCFGPD